MVALALALPFAATLLRAPAATAQAATADTAPAAAPGSPDEVTKEPTPGSNPQVGVVDRLQSGLLEILNRGDSLRTEEGIRALGALVSDTFDIDAMGTVAVGRVTFEKWSPWQRQTFLDSFTRFMVASHASRFEDAEDQSFAINGVKPAQRGRSIVSATYRRAGAEPVAVDYLMQQAAAGWRILDVYLDGEVSLLALHRAEFASVLRNKGYDGFIAAMNAKSAELESRAVN